jgi:D-proline reductase (dithiol) PrdB
MGQRHFPARRTREQTRHPALRHNGFGGKSGTEVNFHLAHLPAGPPGEAKTDLEPVAKVVDSYRFLDTISKRAMRRWAALGTPGPIPWTPLAKPLSRCKLAIVSSAGIALRTDPPFDDEIERRDPWFSDPSFRILPRSTRTGDVRVCHLHINTSFAAQDLNCVMPLERLAELEAAGEISRSAPSHYSYMGYTLRPERLLRDSVPKIIQRLRDEHVDVVLLVPV